MHRMKEVKLPLLCRTADSWQKQTDDKLFRKLCSQVQIYRLSGLQNSNLITLS